MKPKFNGQGEVIVAYNYTTWIGLDQDLIGVHYITITGKLFWYYTLSMKATKQSGQIILTFWQHFGAAVKKTESKKSIFPSAKR